MSRKILLILIIILIIAGAGGGYWYFFVRQISTTPTGQTNEQSGFRVFSPFGQGTPVINQGTTGGQTAQTPTQSGNSETPVNNSKFRHFTSFAVSGAVFFEDTRPIIKAVEVSVPAPTTAVEVPLPTKTVPAKAKTPTEVGAKKTAVVTPKPTVPTFELVPSIRYVERATGHIYQKYLDTKAEAEISNSTIPAIYEAVFGGNAKNLIYRYVSDDGNSIESFMGTLGGKSGEFMSENIQDISVSPDTNKFFYLSPFANGVVGIVRSFSDTKKSQIFSSPFTDWLSQWANAQTIFLTTKASFNVAGSVYSLDSLNGNFRKIFGGVNGLTTLAGPSGTNILYSATTNSGPKMAIYQTATHATTNLELYGLPEKCVWSKDGISFYCAVPNNISGTQYPDLWYQGLASFNDRFVKVNSQTGFINEIANSTNETVVDGTHLFIDDKEQNLFFINKKDSTLWGLSLK